MPKTNATHPLDIVGDVHGELGALNALGKELGYDVGGGWHHPDGRLLVFLGDLIDRGAHSYDVANLVATLHREGRAVCIMGNHEYNLVAHFLDVPGYEEPKTSNEATIDAVRSNRARWDPILDFFAALPISIRITGLRIIHAVWHVPSLDAIGDALIGPGDISVPRDSPAAWLLGLVEHASPFVEGRLREGLPVAPDRSSDSSHEILMKGYETKAPEPFEDNDGKERDAVRTAWWQDRDAPVPRDDFQVFGHYWNVPPVGRHAGSFAPPHPSGTPGLRAWQADVLPTITDRGRAPVVGDYACVDFNGVTNGSEGTRACVGALRWPEREVVWAVG